MEVDGTIKLLKETLEKIYPEMTAEIPTDLSPTSLEKIKKIAAVASSNCATLAICKRSLEEYKKKKEADITLQYINGNLLKTPKELHLKAILKSELSTVYSYEEQCNNMLDICKQRVMLCQSFIKTMQTEDYTASGSRLQFGED